MTATPPAAMDRPAQELTQELFRRVDALDAGAYASLFAPDARLTFGNQPTLTGRAEIERTLRGFFTTIAGVHHTVVGHWHPADTDTTVVELSAAHDRHDGRTAVVPVAVIYRRDADGLIIDMRVFIDLAPVFAPAADEAGMP